MNYVAKHELCLGKIEHNKIQTTQKGVRSLPFA